jgi:hypothetical protein
MGVAMIWQHVLLARRPLYECRLEVQMLYDRRLSPGCAHAVAAIPPASSI